MYLKQNIGQIKFNKKFVFIIDIKKDETSLPRYKIDIVERIQKLLLSLCYCRFQRLEEKNKRVFFQAQRECAYAWWTYINCLDSTLPLF